MVGKVLLFRVNHCVKSQLYQETSFWINEDEGPRSCEPPTANRLGAVGHPRNDGEPAEVFKVLKIGSSPFDFPPL
jgi:hypothetical protein